MVKCKKGFTFAPGEMAEWSIAAVLKTVELRGSGGSNPSLSAESSSKRCQCKLASFFCIRGAQTQVHLQTACPLCKKMVAQRLSLEDSARAPAAAEGITNRHRRCSNPPKRKFICRLRPTAIKDGCASNFSLDSARAPAAAEGMGKRSAPIPHPISQTITLKKLKLRARCSKKFH